MATTSGSENQRKRTLEALERRFAAEAELLQLQKKTKKPPVGKDGKETPSISSPVPSPLQRRDTSIATPLISSSKKGKFSLRTHAPSQDVEESGPAYSQLQYPIHESLLPTDMKFSSGNGSTVDKILHELLQSGDSGKKYMQGSRIKLDNWILLDNFVQGRGMSTGSQIRALKSHSKRSKKHMSMKQLKKCGMLDLPQAFQKFDMFKPMHEMWNAYMAQLLKTTGKNQLAQCLLGADLHGAIILVAECKLTTMTGVSGIMIRETAETFGIITQGDKFQVVPKRISVFIFQVDCWKITLQGDKLASRNFSL
ncbi:hypothetical protein SLE2022_076760 [Rubroshorea leprosula]